VSAVDPVTKATRTSVLGRVPVIDDHSSPAIYVRDDDRLVAFWTVRGSGPDTDTMFWRIAANSLNIDSWGETRTFAGSEIIDYPQPIEWDNNLRLYHRLGGSSSTLSWVYRESTDGGQSFGSPQTLHNIGYGYCHPYRDGGKLHFAVGDHRMSPSVIGHWYLENGDYYQSDGTLIKSESTAIADTTEITTVADLSNNVKLYDLITDSNGDAYIAFTEHVATGSGGGDGDYRARWAKWDGSQWTVGSEITAMGGSLPETHYYEGGLSLDSQDPTTVYVSVETSNRNYQIQEWTTSDDGASWSKVRDVSPSGPTVTSPTKRGRPISPRGHQDDLRVLWWEGRYDFYTDYKTRGERSF